MLKMKYLEKGQRRRPLSLLNPYLLLFLVILLAGCETAAPENGSEVPATNPPEPTEAVVEPETQPTAEPTQSLPTVAVDNPSAEPSPTTPPELVPPQPSLPDAVQVTDIQLASFSSGFERPTFLTHAGRENTVFVSEQVGRISVIEGGQRLPDLFLDIQDRVGSESLEQGLLSFVFSPNFAVDGYFYAYYTNRDGAVVISRFEGTAATPYLADSASEVILMTLNQPYANHNGGQLHFGPDGYLYIGVGDGGSAGDPENNGQNPATLLGTVLRIDVNGVDAYGIPATNPFLEDPERADEIWAWGLRNPWRFSFDGLTGDLYIADVGQRMWEEVNFQAADSPGGENYGWNILEGEHCYEADSCDPLGMTYPVAEYSHSFGCSITGGYVYRGTEFPILTGNYFFADYCTGNIWSLFRQSDGSWNQNLVLESGHTISSFGEDSAGNLYVLDHATGEIFQIQPVN